MYGWLASQNFPIESFKRDENKSQFNKDFIENYRQWRRIFSWSWCANAENLHGLYNDLLFLPEIFKTEKAEKLQVILHDKKEYVIRIRNLKKALNHGLLLKKSAWGH